MISIGEIKARYKNEMALAILTCRIYFGKATGDELRQYISSNDIDWSTFEKIITTHQVRPFMYKILSAYTDCIDAGFLDKLRNNCMQIATGNLRKLEELTRLHRLLKDNGVANVPYKGVILSSLLFGDFITRETADIDIIIDPVSFSRTRDILVSEGYETRYYHPDFEKHLLSSGNEILFSKITNGRTIKVEVHWGVTNEMFNIRLTNSDILNDLQKINLPGGEVDIINLQNHLLVLLVHHGVNDIWRSLRHSIDLAVFLDKYRDKIDWNSLYAASVKCKIRHTAQVGFLIAYELFGLEIPGVYNTTEQLPVGIADNLLHFPPVRKRKLTPENIRQHLFLRDSFQDKVRLLFAYMRAGIAPSIRDLEAFPVAKRWYILYYFIKPFRILFKKTSNTTK